MADHPTWGPYLAERSDRVDDLAGRVRVLANGPPGWLPKDVDLSLELAKDITVWRAAHRMPDSDTRPTGPEQADFTAREHQRLLDQRVGPHVDRQGASWLAPITMMVGRRDAHTPVLAERLAGLARQGHNVHHLLETAARQGDLPDDHATAALGSRITRLLDVGSRTTADRRQNPEDQAPRMDRPRGGPGIGW